MFTIIDSHFYHTVTVSSQCSAITSLKVNTLGRVNLFSNVSSLKIYGQTLVRKVSSLPELCQSHCRSKVWRRKALSSGGSPWNWPECWTRSHSSWKKTVAIIEGQRQQPKLGNFGPQFHRSLVTIPRAGLLKGLNQFVGLQASLMRPVALLME